MFESLRGKRLLILGGVPASIEIIEKAHRFGVTAYVTDYLADSPAKPYADKSFMVSTTDTDAVVQLCKQEKIDGVFTGNVDLLLPYYAQICEKANLPCYGTYEHFCLMTDKKRFKDTCRKYQVPVIPEYTYNDMVEDRIQYPVVVKPIDSSGSKGISICNNRSELEKGIQKALSFSPSKQYLIEKYMQGEEVVLYYYFQDGEPHFAGMCDRYVFAQGNGLAQLPTAYIFPSRYTQNHLLQTDKTVKNMFRGIHMQNGPIFLQAFIENGIPYIYEPGYRLNGARDQYIFGAANGLDSADMLIHFALTGKMSTEDIALRIDPMLNGKCACKLSPLIGKGTVAKISGLDAIAQIPQVVKTVPANPVGSTITDAKLGTLAQVAYRAFILADNYEELKHVIDQVQNAVVYEDSDGQSMMLEKFDSQKLLEYSL